MSRPSAAIRCSITLVLLSLYAYGAASDFRAARSFDISAYPQVPVAADINGDGLPDIAVAGDSSITVLLATGHGGFSLPITSTANYSYPSAVVAADFNHDGFADLAVAASQDGELYIYPGLGNGSFNAPVRFSVHSPTYVVAADFNGDGNIDLAACGGMTLAVFLGKGDGTFTALAPSQNGGDSIAVGDFNGDGILDIAAAGTGRNGFVEIALGQGDGTFVKSFSGKTNNPSVYLVIAAGDFNNDGKLDVAVTADNLQVFVGNGDGTLQPGVRVSSDTITGIVLADFDGDGKLDILARGGIGTAEIFLGKGNGTFRNPVQYDAGEVEYFYITGLVPFAVADFNQDGKVDVVAADLLSGSIDILYGAAAGAFQAGQVVTSPNGAGILQVADFNNDGNPDVAMAAGANSYTCNVAVDLGNGRGGFAPKSNLSSSCFLSAIAAGDVNNDGKMDLLTGDSPITVYLGNGDGTFGAGIIFGSLASDSILLGDMNGDGNLDIVAPGAGVNTVFVALGNGDGTFQPAIGYYAPAAGYYGAVADLNGDGILDVIVAAGYTTFDVLLGKGDGSFQPPITVRSPGAGPFIVADLNNDQKVDLIVEGSSLVVLLGNGDGTFQTGHTYGTASVTPTSIAALDVNGDGNIDVAIGSTTYFSNNYFPVIFIYTGDGTGALYQQESFKICCGATQLAAVDVNRDGKPDLLMGGSALDVVLNTSH